MIYVGIDIAKLNHFASALSSDGEILLQQFSFSNSYDGFCKLQTKLEPFGTDNLVIALESTAHYGNNLVEYLVLHGYKVCILNPLQTSSFRRNNIRKTKTDKLDTFLIAKTLMANPTRFVTKRDIDILHLRNLGRFRQNLIKKRTRAKIQFTSYVDQAFPELQYFFKSGLHIKTCYELLKSYPSPDDIAALHLSKLSNFLSKASRGRFGKQDAKSLKSLAKSSVGVKNTFISIQITQTIAQIELIESQIDELENIIEKAMDELDSVIMTVPGIGKINGAMILAEIGDIKRFSHPSKLLAYAGLDPVVNQSGKFNAKHTKMSKRGSKMLRYALINAAWNVSLNNDTFKRYFDSKIAQGNSHYSALGHTAHKLVRVLFKLLTDNIPFALV
jgi:transposase